MKSISVTDLPKGKKTVSSRRVFNSKYHIDGDIERHKNRLVANGYTQTYGEQEKTINTPFLLLQNSI